MTLAVWARIFVRDWIKKVWAMAVKITPSRIRRGRSDRSGARGFIARPGKTRPGKTRTGKIRIGRIRKGGKEVLIKGHGNWVRDHCILPVDQGQNSKGQAREDAIKSAQGDIVGKIYIWDD